MITRAIVAGLVVHATLAVAGQAPPGVIGVPRFEVTAVRAVRPALEDTVTALEEGDMAFARAAFEAYALDWASVEIYISARSQDIYNALERDYRAKITAGLRASAPDRAALLADARGMLAKYDEAIGLVERGAPLNRLFDQIVALRIVQARLRVVPALVSAGKLHEARDVFTGLAGMSDGVADLVRERSADAQAAIDHGMTDTARLLASDDPDVAAVTGLVNGVVDKYAAVIAEMVRDALSRP